TVSVAALTTPLYVAVSVAAVAAATGCVVIAKLALVAPAAKVGGAGTRAAGLPLARATSAPPTGAADVSVTVPVAPVPPRTAVGFSVTTFRAAGRLTVSVAVFATPL